MQPSRNGEIWMTLFQHGVDCVGLVPVERWRNLLSRATKESGFLGLETALHPRDLGALTRYQDAIQRIPARYPFPGPLSLDELARFAETREGQDAVRWQGLA